MILQVISEERGQDLDLGPCKKYSSWLMDPKYVADLKNFWTGAARALKMANRAKLELV